MNVDALANEIRRVDGDNTLGAGALAEALMPFFERRVSFERIPYTIAEIDEAMRQIVGPQYVRSSEAGWVRPHAMLSAASQAWISERPDDQHSRILRSALLDLNETGVLKPHDGVWPE